VETNSNLDLDMLGFLVLFPEIFLINATIILLIYEIVFSTSKKYNYRPLVYNVSWLSLLSICVLRKVRLGRQTKVENRWKEIRTPGILNTSIFKTDSFNHSDMHLYLNQITIINLILICYENENLGKNNNKKLRLRSLSYG
jgi:hypothetical protein